jgi:hypothetical protein
MTPRSLRLCLAVVAFVAFATLGCDDDEAVPAPTATSTPAATATATSTPTPQPTATPAVTVIDPCTLRDSLEGQPLVAGPAYGLDEDSRWQLCIGGAAAGSSEKYLFGTEDGGVSWTLLSTTTLGNPPPEPGVGELPNGNAAEALFFLDAEDGWLGLSGPGENLFRSGDGGVTWTFVDVLEPGVPVTAIEFADAGNGTLTTPEGDWTTTDGGETWAPAP